MTNTPSSTETSNNPYASPPGKRRSRSWLYLPFIIFGLLIAAYTGYWFFAKGKIETGINDFLTQQKEAGAEVTYTSKRLHGYPFRFTLTVEDPHFANPENQIGWTGEKLQINMQPWNWFHYIIRSSGRNEITANGENFTALLGPGSALSFGLDGTAGFTLDTADIVTAQGDLNTQNLKFSLVEAGVNSPGKRILMDWDFIRLSDEILSLLGEDGAFLGNEIQASRLRLEGQGFSVFGPADTRKAELAQRQNLHSFYSIGVRSSLAPKASLTSTIKATLKVHFSSGWMKLKRSKASCGKQMFLRLSLPYSAP